MKEREIDAFAMPWANARVAQLLSMHRAVAVVVDDQTSESADPIGYDEVFFTRNMETLEAFFLPCYIHESGKGLHRGMH